MSLSPLPVWVASALMVVVCDSVCDPQLGLLAVGVLPFVVHRIVAPAGPAKLIATLLLNVPAAGEIVGFPSFGMTVIVTDRDTVPPDPLQLITYVDVDGGDTFM